MKYSFNQTADNVTLSVDYDYPTPLAGSVGPYTVTATLTVGEVTMTMTGAEWEALTRLALALTEERIDNAIAQALAEQENN